jgi:hypothetical protein
VPLKVRRPMHRAMRPLAFVLLALVLAGASLETRQAPAPQLRSLSQALLTRLPPDWRESSPFPPMSPLLRF